LDYLWLVQLGVAGADALHQVHDFLKRRLFSVLSDSRKPHI
jgi:hypothetical protein